MRICVDIDGVLSNKLKWTIGDSYLRKKGMFEKIGVNEAFVKKVNSLYKKGHTIILNTSRIWHDYDVTSKWLKKNKIKYHTLIMAKPLADLYVDDKNILMEDFLKLK